MSFTAAWRNPDYNLVERWEDDQPECGWCGLPVLSEHVRCDESIAERTCYNAECREYGTCFVDYQGGEPCEVCGMPLGACPECAGTGDDPVHTWGNGDIPNPSLAALHAACERCDGTGLAS